MTFPTDWDVEKYHVEHESDEHWELRRRFLEAHKDKYPEERLVCLAQVFYNVEFMGCRYPEKTMRLVAQLSQGVADDHREKMKTKLQRTFVQASDAASTKVKGTNKNKDAAQNTKKPINFLKSSESNENSSKNIETEPNHTEQSSNEPSTTNNIPGRYVIADQSRFQESKVKNKRPAESQSIAHSKKIKSDGDIFSRLVLMQNANTAPYGILTSSAAASRMSLKLENKKKGSGVEVTLYIDNNFLAKAVGKGIAEAKSLCATEALEKLKKCCYTVIVKDRLAGSVIDKCDVVDADKKNQSNEPLPDDSKASRMMKLMGWGGGGLGKNQQGRKEPVQVVEHVKRAGLGRQEEGGAAFRKSMTEMLQKFKRSNANHDIVFASDFSKEERKLIHNIASKFGLKSVSYGKDADRQLVVSRKKSPLEIVEEVKEAGGSTAKYDLIPPNDD